MNSPQNISFSAGGSVKAYRAKTKRPSAEEELEKLMQKSSAVARANRELFKKSQLMKKAAAEGEKAAKAYLSAQ